jgi:UDP-glucose 4-epimerase
MKILVTGGAGFIGSHVTENLINEGHNVHIIDNLSTGNKKNIPEKAVLHQIDITDFLAVNNFFKEEKPEIIYHLAAQIDVRKSVAEPLNDAQVNILASLNLIRLAHEFNIKKFIFSSTGGAIYGDTDQRPTKENQPEQPLSPYGIGKLSIDKYLHYYHTVHGLPYVSLRYGNVFGPRQNPHGEAGVVAIFIQKMKDNQPPVINGDGNQTRDYIFVEDVSRANLMALRNFDTTGIFNVGTGKEISVNEIFDSINECFEKRFQRKYGPGKAGEQLTSCLDYTKIHQAFGWEPSVNFKEGIKKTYEWFLKQGA